MRLIAGILCLLCLLPLRRALACDLELIQIGETRYSINVLSSREFPERIRSFNKSLGENGGVITSCQKIVDLPVGTVNGNHSYGGFCRITKSGLSKKVMICNDVLVGHFKSDILFEKAERDAADLAEYVVHNCYGS